MGSKPEPRLAVSQSDQVQGDLDVAGGKLPVVLVAVDSESRWAVLLMDGYLDCEIAVLEQPPSLRSPDKSFSAAMPMTVVVVMAVSAFLFVTDEAYRPPVTVLSMFVMMFFFSIMISTARELSVMVMPMSVVFIVILRAYLRMTVSVTD